MTTQHCDSPWNLNAATTSSAHNGRSKADMSAEQPDWEYSTEYLGAMFQAEILRRREWLKRWYGKCPDHDPECDGCKLWKLQEEFEQIVK